MTDPGPRLGLQLDFFIDLYLPEIDHFRCAGLVVLSVGPPYKSEEDLIALDTDFIFWSNTSTSR